MIQNSPKEFQLQEHRVINVIVDTQQRRQNYDTKKSKQPTLRNKNF